MATLDEAALQLADSLPVDAVPAKLRCASCNKLAVNAVKLPCCDQSICQPCSKDLPEACPICSHSPVSAEDCKPNKNVRMTVSAFLKGEQRKKKNKDSEKAAQPAGSPAPAVQSIETPAPVAVTTAESEPQGDVSLNANSELASATPALEQGDAGQGAEMPAAEIPQDITYAAEPEGDAAQQEEDEETDDEDEVVITTEKPEQELHDQVQYGGDPSQDQGGQDREQSHSQMNGLQYGYDQNQQGFGNGNMDFSNMNNFNPMMAMQNGMGMGGFMGMPNMMGMPGMNMDPSMMFNGGFGGNGGMNDMSGMMNMMGMGMNGMGNFGGMPGMNMNMGNGNGPNGFFAGNGGYNQNNFGNHMNPNFHNNRGYGGRPYNGRGGFGRGRGFYNQRGGRGGWQNYGQGYGQQNENHMNQQYGQQSHHQQAQQQQQTLQNGDESAGHGARRGSPSYEPMTAADDKATDNVQPRQQDPDAEGGTNAGDEISTDQAGNDSTQAGTNDEDGVEQVAEGKIELPSVSASALAKDSGVVGVEAEIWNEDVAKDGDGETSHTDSVMQSVTIPVDSAQDDHNTPFGEQQYNEQNQQGFGYGPRGRGGFRGRAGFRGQGGAYGNFTTLGHAESPPAPPINAPTGPKAMRDGLPNHGQYSRPPLKAPVAASPQPQPERHERERSYSRSPSRSRHRSRKERSRSPDEETESEEAYTRRKERERRKQKDRESRHDGEMNGDESGHKGRSRSESREDKESRRRHRDRDDDHHSSRSHRDRSREKRKHRRRSRSPERDGDVDDESSRRKSKSDRRREDDYEDSDRVREKEKSRKSSRRDDNYYDDGKDRSHHSSRHGRSSRDDRDRDRERNKSQIVAEDSDSGFKIKGAKAATLKAGGGLDTSMAPPSTFGHRDHSSRRSSMQVANPGTPTTPAALDPYAAEREEMERKRKKHNLERRQSSTQSLGKRQSREDEEVEAPAGPKGDVRGGKRRKDGRKFSARYEDEIEGEIEGREGRRW